MREYQIDLQEEEESIDTEKMSAEELYEKLSDGFAMLYIPEKRMMEYAADQKI